MFCFVAVMIRGVAESELQDEHLGAGRPFSLDPSSAGVGEEPVSAHLIIELELVMRGDPPALRAELAKCALQRLAGVRLAMSGRVGHQCNENRYTTKDQPHVVAAVSAALHCSARAALQRHHAIFYITDGVAEVL